ncbi:benzoate 4-monooxygenase cytochrome P450, partial [Ilyonectria sp. MPI-CAGE-AT-0026]
MGFINELFPELNSVQLGLALAAAVVLLPLIYYFLLAIYNLYFHPLARYPGPFLARCSTLWRIRGFYYGTEAQDILDAHNTYGAVVRLAPDELSYINPNAWKEIYGHKLAGRPEFPKNPGHHANLTLQNILNADQEYHGILRRILAHGFSDKALREQEPVLIDYANTLVKKINDAGQNGKKAIDMAEWFNFFTFDVIGFLTYGEPFGSLMSSDLHPWIEIMFILIRQKAFFQCLARLPPFLRKPFDKALRPKVDPKIHEVRTSVTRSKIQHRLQLDNTTADLAFKLIDAYKANKMTLEQLESNAYTLIMGGSETTATLLCGATYYLLETPSALAKLTKEIRAQFSDPGEINLTSINKCTYLFACLNESLRIYPPSPQTHTRVVPKGGATIDGGFVPEGTTVGVPIFAVCHSPANFKDPSKFIPERWIGHNPVYEN